MLSSRIRFPPPAGLMGEESTSELTSGPLVSWDVSWEELSLSKVPGANFFF